MKTLGAAAFFVGTVALGVLAGGKPERDIFVKVTVTGGQVAADTVLIYAANVMPANAALGQQGVSVYRFSMMRLGEEWKDPIYLVGMRFSFENLKGAALDPFDVISQIYLEVEAPAQTRYDPGTTSANPTDSTPAAAGPVDRNVTGEYTSEAGGSGRSSNLIPAAAEHRTGAYLDVDLLKPVLVSAAQSLTVHCLVDIAPDTRAEGFVMKLDENSISLDSGDSPYPCVILTRDGGPGTEIHAATTVIPRTLRESFANYPNPFAAGRELTTFAFYLPRNADVSLKLFTGFGRLVKVLDPGTPRSGPLVHEDIRWDGTDERGARVQNGAYFAVLQVRYADGVREQVVRKVAVLR